MSEYKYIPKGVYILTSSFIIYINVSLERKEIVACTTAWVRQGGYRILGNLRTLKIYAIREYGSTL